jgi:hypothetical protein
MLTKNKTIMKKTVLFILIPVMAVFFAVSCGTSSKLNRMENKMQERTNKMNDKGGFAFLGYGVAPAGRRDLGRLKAKQDAVQKMSEAKKQYIKSMVHDFREAVGADKNTEVNDLLNSVVDAVSANILKGARIVEFDAFETKANKEDGNYTYMVIYAINPEFTYESLVGEIKKSNRGSKENLYQRFVDSEASKKQKQQIDEYNKMFGVEDN